MKQSARKLRKHRKRAPMVHRSYAEKRNRSDKHNINEAKDFTKR